MKEKTDYYPQYKKLLKLKDEKPASETKEFRILAERYPHIAESIRLKDEMRRLKEKLKSVKERATKFQMKKEMSNIKAKLKREGIRKKLHGEHKQERLFHTRFVVDLTKEKLSSMRKKSHATLERTHTKVGRRLSTLRQQRLPPSLLDLRSLYLAEKNTALKEWVQNHRKRP